MSNHLRLSRDRMIVLSQACDRGADGQFVVAVKTTGIYCLPSCRPPRKPKPENVDFYATPEEARAAGFRACKLCRPDDFYAGLHPEEAQVEGLVAGLLLDPGAYHGVSTLSAAIGVGATKLHELFRTYYHATPADLLTRARIAAARRALLHGDNPVAEIAFEVGFDSLSAFNDNFARYTAMRPLEYRRLAERPTFTLALPDDYPAERILRYLGRDPHSLTERVDGRSYTATFRLNGAGSPGGNALVRVDLGPGAAHCEVLTPAALGPAQMGKLHDHLLGVLGLVIDPSRFESQVLASAELAPLLDGQRGLRVPLIADPFDALVWAIVGQQVNLAFAHRLRRRLIERVSAAAGAGLYAPPSPEAVAQLTPEDLVALRFSRAKAGYLVGAARSVVDGRLPLAAMVGKSATRIERTLLAVRGIGPWSAHYLMMRCFGFLDCVPLGDTGLATGLERFFALSARPDKRDQLALMGRFSPYRSLATFHLWQRLGAAA
jgi:AraC family transcriptional regulator of adaptative response / DNA-3-methyladenine glycosylase II